MKRLLSIDFLRGVAIVFMIIIHIIVYGIFTPNVELVDDFMLHVPPIGMLLLSPIILFSSWASIFVLVNGIATTYIIIQKWQENPQFLSRVILIRFCNAFLLILVSYLARYFLLRTMVYDYKLYYSMITGSIDTGTFQVPDVKNIFTFVSILVAIALNTIIISSFLYFALKNKTQISVKKILITLLGTLVVCWILFVILEQINLIYSPFQYLREHNLGALAFILMRFFGYKNSLLPTVLYSLLGACYGILICFKITNRKLRIISYIIGFALIVTFIILFILHPFDLFTQIATEDPASVWEFLSIGLLVIISTFFVFRLDFSPSQDATKLSRRTRGFRRFGRISLSVYIFESLTTAIFRRIFLLIGGNTVFPWIFWIDLIFVGLNLAFWLIIVPLWEKIEFKGSIEWVMVQANYLLTHYKSTKLAKEEEYHVNNTEKRVY